MFEFEKFSVYKQSKDFSLIIFRMIKNNSSFDIVLSNQLRRASLSCMLNIAEGSGRYSKKDRRHFYVIARGSLLESVAILDFLKELESIDNTESKNVYDKAESISRILYMLINKPVTD